MKTIGTGILHDSVKEFQWKIENFFSIRKRIGKHYSSPSFLFAGESWHLNIFPNGQSHDNSTEYIGVYLYREVSGSPKKVEFSFSLETFEGTKANEKKATYVFEDAGDFGYGRFCERSTLIEKKSELVPSGILNILCSITSCSKATNDEGNKCSYCEGNFDANYVSTHEKKCNAKPIKCPKCKEKVNVRKCFDHECQLRKLKGTDELVDDLINIFGSGEHSDVTIKVKGEEFQLHRCILACRNSFFNAMFKTEMKEKTTGIVTIDDCKPEVFRSFIHFLYTGKVDELSLENVCDLYEATDKYQEDRLKAECLCFMKGNMSVDTFCDFTILAHTYNEKDLLQNATDFYCKNVRKIIRSIKWQTFMKDYSTLATELNIKAFAYMSRK